MPDIVLTTLNARFAHAAFGLRYLLANLGPELRQRAGMLEFDVNQRPLDVLETILLHDPKIVGIGVYIWNAVPICRRFDAQEVCRAFSRTRAKTGNRIAARMAMIAITIISSIKVNPRIAAFMTAP